SLLSSSVSGRPSQPARSARSILNVFMTGASLELAVAGSSCPMIRFGRNETCGRATRASSDDSTPRSLMMRNHPPTYSCTVSRDRCFRPQLEHMEARALLATFTVDSTADAVDANPGDGTALTASGQITLRSAIQEANALAGSDTIVLPVGTYA